MTAPRKNEYVAAAPHVPSPTSANANASNVRKAAIVYLRNGDKLGIMIPCAGPKPAGRLFWLEPTILHARLQQSQPCPIRVDGAEELSEFTTTPRILPISAFAFVTGIVSVCVALVLLKLIGFFTNLLSFIASARPSYRCKDMRSACGSSSCRFLDRWRSAWWHGTGQNAFAVTASDFQKPFR
jgi:hypothetical protein